LMKATAKRRRSKKLIEEEKLQAEKEAREIKKKVAEYDQMKQDMQDYESLKDRLKSAQAGLDKANEMANGLIEAGVLVTDEKGELALSQQQPQVSGLVDQINSSLAGNHDPTSNQETIAQKLSRQEAQHYGLGENDLHEAGN